MKKIAMLLVALVAFNSAVFAGGQADGSAKKDTMKVGMVTDAGTIDDKSFNQGTWEGILEIQDKGIVQAKYLRPTGTTQADYMKEVVNLYDAGFKFIVTPGFKFETTIFAAQNKYKDASFVLIDGYPHAGDWNPQIADNTVAILYAEHESGFLAAVAAALQVKEGEFGFIGGMEIPAVQKFNWGYQQGIKYANENLGTNITLKQENVIYQGSFDNVAAGQQLAAGMYDKGVDVIFACAGGVGVGVINEAKARAKAGDKTWVIGVDVDQYAEGIYDGTNSIILTSATKKIAHSVAVQIEAKINGTFPGGKLLIFDASNDGVGIPAENPNLDADVTKKVAKIFADIKAKKITVADKQGDLIK